MFASVYSGIPACTASESDHAFWPDRKVPVPCAYLKSTNARTAASIDG